MCEGDGGVGGGESIDVDDEDAVRAASASFCSFALLARCNAGFVHPQSSATSSSCPASSNQLLDMLTDECVSICDICAADKRRRELDCDVNESANLLAIRHQCCSLLLRVSCACFYLQPCFIDEECGASRDLLVVHSNASSIAVVGVESVG